MTPPKRIRLSRAKGWRKPSGAIVVARPTIYGNPFVIGVDGDPNTVKALYREWLTRNLADDDPWGTPPVIRRADIEALRGFDLACWCPPDQPCHADVLLELANQETAP
jgi:hypothetical protein